MKNNYEDFCIVSPEKYELLAKKNNEQLKTKVVNEQNNYSQILNLLKENILAIENFNTSFANYDTNYLQKIYIKTYSLFEDVKKINNNSTTMQNNNDKNLTKQNAIPHTTNANNNNIYMIKKSNTNNLCQILNELIYSTTPNKELLIKVVNIIKLWNVV